jgi:hypothetical protein
VLGERCRLRLRRRLRLLCLCCGAERLVACGRELRDLRSLSGELRLVSRGECLRAGARNRQRDRRQDNDEHRRGEREPSVTQRQQPADRAARGGVESLQPRSARG